MVTPMQSMPWKTLVRGLLRLSEHFLPTNFLLPKAIAERRCLGVPRLVQVTRRAWFRPRNTARASRATAARAAYFSALDGLPAKCAKAASAVARSDARPEHVALAVHALDAVDAADRARRRVRSLCHAAGRLASSAALAKARFPSRCAAHRCAGGCALAQPARASPAPPQCTWRECRACGHSTLVHRDRCGRGTPGDRYYGRFCGSSSLRAAGVLVEKVRVDHQLRLLFAVPAASSPDAVAFGIAPAHDADAAPQQC